MKGSLAFMQHFKFKNWRIRFLMSRTGYWSFWLCQQQKSKNQNLVFSRWLIQRKGQFSTNVRHVIKLIVNMLSEDCTCFVKSNFGPGIPNKWWIVIISKRCFVRCALWHCVPNAVSICTRILKYRVWKIEFDELGFLSSLN